ncbi:MAG TPA: SUMF1/EgtB/PvdO family nonheme iron enzyme, partial [Verrucomicrobiae bacterium]|nr:SUMF1/EgtB/PvdO family nonheme iron enzyme [Verrucomicrobiae bacterium]
PLYIAPEQAEGRREVDYRADFYALGATLYHLATGKPPYDGSSGVEVIGKHLHAPVPDARAINPELSRPFAELLKRLMAKRAEDRPQKHSEIEKELDRCGALLAEEFKEQSRIAHSAALKVVQRSWVDEPVTWIAAAVVAAVLVAGAFLYARFSKGPDADAVLGMGSTMADGRLPTGDGTTKGTKDTTPESSSSRFSSPAAVASSLIAATKDKPFVNSLGMEFVPIPGTHVLFSIWETRVKDFEAFVRETGYAWREKPPFEQGPDHPVVQVSWNDAKAFCDWLSKKEGIEYRLPTDEEWDVAVGKDTYPWGEEWPPEKGVANIAGEEARIGQPDDPTFGVLGGYRDDHPRTATVGSYPPTEFGLYDLSGNVSEFCEDWFTGTILEKHRASAGWQPPSDTIARITKENACRVSRGGHWGLSRRETLNSFARGYPGATGGLPNLGFRCVLATAAADRTSTISTRTAVISDRPFENSLGMKFVPIPGTQVLFSIWETRVKDFEAFVKESGYDWHEKPPFEQGPDHPVVRVSWNDAKAFCDWLSKKEARQYRLPTDEEWDVAAGSAKYPWGDEWPPPTGMGNFAGDESKLGKPEDPKEEWMTEGYRDEHPRTAPVGSYRPLSSGLYDLSGNVWEWCEDWFDQRIMEKRRAAAPYEPTQEDLADIMKGNVRKLLRGGSWADANRFGLQSFSRYPISPDSRYSTYGFRCVVVGPVSITSPPATALPSAVSIPTEATKDQPFVNSLGMKFVPIQGTKVLFSIWETRVRDFEAFVKDSGYRWAWSNKAGFVQTPDDPVVQVSWNDAMAFCEWVGKKEGRQYRLPTDEEWSTAAGKEEFPWGTEWPPPEGAGNFAGEESRLGLPEDPKVDLMIGGYSDSHPRTAPVGSYRPLPCGLYDLSGNVWEWCEDWYAEGVLKKFTEGGGRALPSEQVADIMRGDVRKVIRGGAWNYSPRSELRCSCRYPALSGSRYCNNNCGFRCVLVLP